MSDVKMVEGGMDQRAKDLWELRDKYASLLARHNALREAVAWERECIRQLDYAGKFWEDDNIPGRELIKFLDAARVEVDRILSEESINGNS